MRTFVTKCVVGDIVTEGEGNGKKGGFAKGSFNTPVLYDGIKGVGKRQGGTASSMGKELGGRKRRDEVE